MATYDLEEQEQLAEIKTWWKQNGNLLLNVLTAASLVVIAWQGWNFYQRSQSAQASMVYHALQNAVQVKDSQRIKAASGELLEKFSRSSYASIGALTAAKALVDSGDAKTAKVQLLWVVEHGKDEMRDLARLRLAALLLDEKAYDEALKQLDGKVSPAFEARFMDNRGDILNAQGKSAEARSAYQNALTKLAEAEKPGKSQQDMQGWQAQSNAIYRELLQQKRDAIGGGKE
ncbi:MAG: tetratricopeptide repeat protein [Betaproteobacteria bacterium]